MFFASLIAAGFQLGAAAAVFAFARARTVNRLCLALVAGLLGVVLLPAMLTNGVVFLQGIVLAVIGIACVSVKARQEVFVGWAIAATVSVIGVVGWSGVHSWAGLKEQYPFESMSERLAYEAKVGERRPYIGSEATQLLDAPVLPEATLTRLNGAENQRWPRSRRSEALRLVHASHVEQFIASPGFGVGRMIRPTPYAITFGDKRALASYELDRRPDLNGSPEPGAVSSGGERLAGMTSVFGDALDRLHDEARNDFLASDAFGYIRDREHVAGFVPHGFLNGVPGFWPARQHWLTVRVELVSLIKHDRPLAYVSEHLPNMTELREAPVRELDAFEQQALASLVQGEDLASDVQIDRIRALGSLRAMKQCLACHEVPRGTLLGAFSYEFLRDLPVQRKPKNTPSTGSDRRLL